MVSIDRPFLNTPHFRNLKKKFKGPRPFKQQKTFSAVKQLTLGQVLIMWRLLQKTL
jgi:hypothetical protein